MRRLFVVAGVVLATGCPDDPAPAPEGTTGGTVSETTAPSTSSTTTDASTSTGETTEASTGSTTAGESTEESSGPGTTTTGVTCQELPEIDMMPPECPGDQALANPPITCVIGNTLAPGDDVSTCAAAPIPGSAYGFIANQPGVWVFTAIATGTDPDPLIVVFDDMNNELGCSTDLGSDATPTHQAGGVAVTLAAAQSVRIVVQPEAIPGAAAPVVLHVALQVNCGGDCCEVDRARTSCEYEDYSTCVCTADPACCADGWNEDCVALAAGLCGLGCGEYP